MTTLKEVRMRRLERENKNPADYLLTGPAPMASPRRMPKGAEAAAQLRGEAMLKQAGAVLFDAVRTMGLTVNQERDERRSLQTLLELNRPTVLLNPLDPARMARHRIEGVVELEARRDVIHAEHLAFHGMMARFFEGAEACDRMYDAARAEERRAVERGAVLKYFEAYAEWCVALVGLGRRYPGALKLAKTTSTARRTVEKQEREAREARQWDWEVGLRAITRTGRAEAKLWAAAQAGHEAMLDDLRRQADALKERDRMLAVQGEERGEAWDLALEARDRVRREEAAARRYMMSRHRAGLARAATLGRSVQTAVDAAVDSP